MAASPELTGAREAKVGDITVRRFLPLRHRRTVGAWCFVDHYGPMSVDGVALLYLGTGHQSLPLAAAEGSKLFLLGGEPLGEPVLMWWNFVGRTADDMVEAARDWERGLRFGKVAGPAWEPLPAPPLDATTLKWRR